VYAGLAKELVHFTKNLSSEPVCVVDSSSQSANAALGMTAQKIKSKTPRQIALSLKVIGKRALLTIAIGWFYLSPLGTTR
jgi:hypothetical protein